MKRSVSTYWICIQTKMSEDFLAASHIRRQTNRECYIPVWFNKRTDRRQNLFPGYIFLDIGGERNWKFVNGTRGVTRVLLLASSKDDPDPIPMRVPADEIAALKVRENKNGVIDLSRVRFEEGQHVVGRVGSFDGVHGIVEGMSDSDRIRVLFTILGRSVPKVMRESEIRAA